MQGSTEAREAGPRLASGGRMHSLDVLRGFALLGILVMNIQAFAMPMAAYANPTVWGDLSGANFAVWLLSHLFADEKMMAIFSILFGAGIALFTDRAEQRGDSAARLHYRRNAWLLLFGAAHGYLLWYGDILFLYAVCAFAIFPFRKLSPPTLFALGIALLSVSSVLFLYFGWSMSLWSEAQLASFKAEWNPAPAMLAQEVAIYRGDWLEQLAHRAPITAEAQTFVLVVWGFWRAAGLMLIGMGLYRLGVLSGLASNVTYWCLLMAGLLIGLPLVGYGVVWNFANDWGPQSLFLGSQFNYWGSLPVSLGWVAGIMLLLRHGALRWLTQRLAAVGRMAFTHYILQTVFGVLLFYGQGLALFGQVERTGQIAIVLAIWLVQLLLSPIWLRHFRAGPLEWLWRSLTYGQRQPFRRL
ncbi:DUF418 domain-containing protein [Halomonas sp. ANAO-440]|uniref:DUF418 domain-containing protein n=1 Tax=Halomonas sp. ANAO-440 TaxID=2861360 RepID=UPI001CAA628E|nr:DUF418 domain-containing protein [Halomonas sp. ANAO-440]MBZ0331322.1 DUF418 domain-containing protein [Halomonas sp. ANAO-440]